MRAGGSAMIGASEATLPFHDTEDVLPSKGLGIVAAVLLIQPAMLVVVVPPTEMALPQEPATSQSPAVRVSAARSICVPDTGFSVEKAVCVPDCVPDVLMAVEATAFAIDVDSLKVLVVTLPFVIQ